MNVSSSTAGGENFNAPINLQAELAKWTPKGEKDLNFILNFTEMEKDDINILLIKAEKSIHFDKSELKEVVYKILNSLRIDTSEARQKYRLTWFAANCRELNSNSLFQFINKELVRLEKDHLKSRPFTEIKPSQIIILYAKELLNQKLTNYLSPNNGGIISLEMEARFMAADLALRKILFIPTELTYQNIENDPLTQEDKERLYGEIRKDMPIAIFSDFEEYIKKQPEIQREMEKNFIAYGEAINDNLIISYVQKMCEDHYETLLLNKIANDIFYGIKNATNKDI